MNKNKYVLSIDNGLTIVKTALVDLGGKILNVRCFKNGVMNNGCYSEVDMDLLYKNTLVTIKEII